MTRQASFRSIPFYVEEYDFDTGRRVALHEYPQRDIPWSEDMGRKARVYKIRAFVVGDTWEAQRDALIAACEQPGPGILVHPVYGELSVACDDCKVSEHLIKGKRIAQFTLKFVESGRKVMPNSKIDTRARLDKTVLEALDTFRSVLAASYAVAKFPQYIRQAAGDLVGGFVDIIQDFVLFGEKATTSVQEIISIYGRNKSVIIDDPTQLASSIRSIITAAGKIVSTPRRATSKLLAAYEFDQDLPVPPQTTSNRQRQFENHLALVRAIKRCIIASAAQAASYVDIQSYEGAVKLRDEILKPLDAEIQIAGDTGDDVAFQALYAVRTAFGADIEERGLQLPNLVTKTVPSVVPARVLAYGEFSDATRYPEIVTRNSIRHPGFVPNTEIEVTNR